MTRAEIRGLVLRVQGDLYFGPENDADSIMVRLARIEEKLENVVTKEDLEMKTTGLKAELIAHSNATFRWTIGIFIMGAGILLAILKLT